MRGRPLLLCGVVAGPVFTITAAAQALTRDGYDLTHQPLSLLSLGELGWVQITSFVVTGLLTVAFASGVRGALGETTRWGPRLLALNGAGFVMAVVLGFAWMLALAVLLLRRPSPGAAARQTDSRTSSLTSKLA